MRLVALLSILALAANAGCMDRLRGDDDSVAPAATGDAAAPPPDEPVDEEASRPASAPPASSSNGSKPAPGSANASASATTPPPPPPPPVAPRVETLSWAGSITGVGAGAKSSPAGPVCCFGANAAEENVGGSFDVPTALKGIVVELVWNDSTLDLDLELDAPDHAMPFPPTGPQMHTGHWWYADGGTPGAPDRHATIAITDAEPLALTGAWEWYVIAKGPANEVAFTVYATLFYDQAPPDGFSAVPATE